MSFSTTSLCGLRVRPTFLYPPPPLSPYISPPCDIKHWLTGNISIDYIVRGYPHIRCVFKLKIPYKAPEARLERLPRPVDIYPLKVDIYRLAKGTNGQFGWSQKSYTICRKGAKVDVELRLSDICRGLPKHVTVRIPADRIIDVAEEAAAMQARHDTQRKLEEEQLEEAMRQGHWSTSDPFALDQQISTESHPFDLD